MSEFMPGTWGVLKPTHAVLPDTVIAARAAVEAAWKRRDQMIEAMYYGDTPLDNEALNATMQEALDLEAAAAVAWADWGIPGSHEAAKDTTNPMDFFGLQ